MPRTDVRAATYHAAAHSMEVDMSVKILPMTLGDHAEVAALWERSDGVGLSDSDGPDGIQQFLERNPGMCFVARDGADLVGAVLCGHDGKRGYIHHLAVAQSHRRGGLGSELADRCLDELREAGIAKCHVFVFRSSQDTLDFWRSAGWFERTELILMSKYTT